MYKLDEFESALPGTLEHSLFENNMRGHRYAAPEAEVYNTFFAEPKVALYIKESHLSYHNESSCQFSAAWKSSSPLFGSFAFPKGSPLTHLFRYHYMRLAERGMTRSEGVVAPEYCPATVTSYNSLGLDSLLSLFTILLLAYSISGVVAIAEMANAGNNEAAKRRGAEMASNSSAESLRNEAFRRDLKMLLREHGIIDDPVLKDLLSRLETKPSSVSE